MTVNLTVTASNGATNGLVLPSPVVNSAYQDGAAGAPFGPANYPTLLSGLTRPPWQVAGVDYHVGYPTNITLKSKASVATIPGVSVSGGLIRVDNPNVVIDGYDLGTSSLVVFANNCTIRNCKIKGAISTVHYVTGINTLTIRNTSILMDTGYPASVTFHGKTLTVEYCLFDGAESDHIQLSGGVNSGNNNFVFRYNFFRNAGSGGGHGDVIQTFNQGPNLLWQVNFNTTGPQVNTQGFMYEPDSSTPGDGAKLTGVGEIGWNTFTGSMNYYVGATYLDVAPTCQSFTVHDNYYDANAVSGFARPNQVVPRDASAKTVFRDNVNMRNGTKPTTAND